MTDPITPAQGGGRPESPAQNAADGDASETPTRAWSVTRSDDESQDHDAASTEATSGDVASEPAAPAEPAAAPAERAAAPAEPAAAPAEPAEAPAEATSAPADEPHYPAVAPDDAAAEPAAAEPHEEPRFDTPSGPAAASHDERPLPALSPPTSAPSASTAANGSLHDDSALRAAEAARSGETTDAEAARPPAVASDAPATSHATGDLDDTRLSAPNGARSSTAAWTPPPAPVSPSEYPAPATAATPTPYAPPPTGATEAIRPVTSTTPLTNLGASPAESLGFTDGIAGGDDGFTPEELAQRRSIRDELAFRQKQEFAGINFGVGFFGWLAATGLATILYSIAGGIAVASGLAQSSVITGSNDTVKSLGSAFDTHTLQITALVVFLVVLFVSYFVGGFVASRMARFSGLKQGLAVWLWGVVTSIIIAVVFVVIASQSSTVSDFQSSNGSMNVNDFTTVPSLIAEGLVLVLSIGGALVGGLAGQSFHRRVDRFGIEDV